MSPFVAIAASILPQILKHFTGANGQADSDAVEQAVTAIVQAVTGKSDPEEAQKKIASDPGAQAQLHARLSELSTSLDSARHDTDSTAMQSMEKRLTDQINALSAQVDTAKQAQTLTASQLQQQSEDTATVKSTLSHIGSPGSLTSLAGPVLSLVIVLGFFASLGFIVSDRFDPSADNSKLQIVNIVIGALTAGFATVLNYWLGSSQGSKNKDLANFSLQHIQALQAGRRQSAEQQAPHNLSPGTGASIKSSAHFPAASAHESQDSSAVVASQSPPQAGSQDTPAASASPAGQTPRVVDATTPPSQSNGSDKEAAFQACVRFVLRNEGGFVDNPNDPGGATNMGITIGTLRAWRGSSVTVEDVKDLSQQEAIQIYRANYWNPLKCDDLPLGVDMVVFDFGVNAGIRRSALTLQKVVGVAEDGIIGPQTIAAVNKQPSAQIVAQFGTERLAYYKQLKEWSEFGKGWTDREAESQSEARSLMS